MSNPRLSAWIHFGPRPVEFCVDDFINRNIENCVTIAYVDNMVAVVRADNRRELEQKISSGHDCC